MATDPKALPAVVTRFAPSPTGPLHLGHAFSALTAWDFAQAHGGEFLLRIEDLDPTRSRPEHEAAIHNDLAWLGLTWPEPVLRQSDPPPRLRRRPRPPRRPRPHLPLPLHPRRHPRRPLRPPGRRAHPPSTPAPAAPARCPTCAPATPSASTSPAPCKPLARNCFSRRSARRDPGRRAARPGRPARHSRRRRARPQGHRRRRLPPRRGRRRRRPGRHPRGPRRRPRPRHRRFTASSRRCSACRPRSGCTTALIRDAAGRRLAKRDDARAIARYRADGLTPAQVRGLVGL